MSEKREPFWVCASCGRVGGGGASLRTESCCVTWWLDIRPHLDAAVAAAEPQPPPEVVEALDAFQAREDKAPKGEPSTGREWSAMYAALTLAQAVSKWLGLVMREPWPLSLWAEFALAMAVVAAVTLAAAVCGGGT